MIKRQVATDDFEKATDTPLSETGAGATSTVELASWPLKSTPGAGMPGVGVERAKTFKTSPTIVLIDHVGGRQGDEAFFVAEFETLDMKTAVTTNLFGCVCGEGLTAHQTSLIGHAVEHLHELYAYE